MQPQRKEKKIVESTLFSIGEAERQPKFAQQSEKFIGLHRPSKVNAGKVTDPQPKALSQPAKVVQLHAL